MLCHELIRDFCDIVSKGNFRMTACRRLGIDYSTYKYWALKAKRDRAAFKEGDEPSIYLHFIIALEMCETEMETSLVQDVVTGEVKDKIWFLEHRWNKKYTRNSNVVLDDDEAELVRIDPVILLAERLQELRDKAGSSE